MSFEGALHRGEVTKGGTRLSEEYFIGLEPEVEEGIVDMKQGHVALGKSDAKEGVFVSIVCNRLTEADGKECGAAYHEVEGGEALIRMLATIVGCSALVGTALVGVA